MKLLAFDLEATGLDPHTDRILELAVVRGEDGLVLFHDRFNPGMPIPPQASAIHGIRDPDVAHCSPFAFQAPAVQKLVTGAVLVGYGSRRFDTVLLDEELRRAGETGLDLGTVQEIDLRQVWIESEPRTLASAIQRFLGHGHDEAHSALADAQALLPLLQAMGRRWSLEFFDFLRRSRPRDEVDRSRRFRIDATGEVVFNFGQHAGEPVREHDDYLDWMLGADFPADTCDAIRALREREWRWR